MRLILYNLRFLSRFHKIFLNSATIALFTLGLGPFFKLAGTAYLSYSQQESAPFAVIWALDAFATFILSFTFFSTDVYLTRVLKEHAKAEQAIIFWIAFVFVIGLSALVASLIGSFDFIIEVSRIAIPGIQGSVVLLSLISVLSLNLFRVLFASLRIMEEKLELLLFSVSYYSIQLFGLVILSKFTDDLVYAYYLSFLPTLLVVLVYAYRTFSFPVLHDYSTSDLFYKYVRFLRTNWGVEPTSSVLNLVERIVFSHVFSVNMINTYAQAIKVVEPITMIGKVVKFVLIGTIVDFVRSPYVEPHATRLTRMRRKLLFMLLLVFLSYPLIAFLSDIWGLNFPPYSILLWLTSTSIIGMLSFYYSTGFFANGDFSKTIIIDFIALTTSLCLLIISGHKSMFFLATIVSTKVAIQFGLRSFHSSKLQGHLKFKLFDISLLGSVLSFPIILMYELY